MQRHTIVQLMKKQLLEGTAEQVRASEPDAQGRYQRGATGWADRRSLEWQVKARDGLQTLHEEPETGFLVQRLLLRLVAPLVPDEHL